MQSRSRRVARGTAMILVSVAPFVLTPVAAQAAPGDCAYGAGYSNGYDAGYSYGYSNGYSNGYWDGRASRWSCPPAAWVPGRVIEGHYGGSFYGEQVHRYVVPDVPPHALPGNARIGYGFSPYACAAAVGTASWSCPSRWPASPYRPY